MSVKGHGGSYSHLIVPARIQLNDLNHEQWRLTVLQTTPSLTRHFHTLFGKHFINGKRLLLDYYDTIYCIKRRHQDSLSSNYRLFSGLFVKLRARKNARDWPIIDGEPFPLLTDLKGVELLVQLHV